MCPPDAETGPLQAWGWDDAWAQLRVGQNRPDLSCGRVILEKRGFYRLITTRGEVAAGTTGRVRHRSEGASELPAVGDWVLYREPQRGDRRAQVHHVLPRRTRLSRKVAGTTASEQVVAANLDTVFVLLGLDGDFNPRRLERFLVVGWESGAQPVVILNKADLSPDPEAHQAQIELIAGGAPVLLTSLRTGEGLAAVEEQLEPGRTVALLGSSGVGKSTLVNRLVGEQLLATARVRESDDRGRHTTTHRQLVRLPGGALLIDNPGVREIQPWVSAEGLKAAFEEVHAVAAGCRFRDCTHGEEPGCAVHAALAAGELDEARVASFRSLQMEQEELDVRKEGARRRQGQRQVAALHRAHRKHRPRD